MTRLDSTVRALHDNVVSGPNVIEPIAHVSGSFCAENFWIAG